MFHDARNSRALRAISRLLILSAALAMAACGDANKSAALANATLNALLASAARIATLLPGSGRIHIALNSNTIGGEISSDGTPSAAATVEMTTARGALIKPATLRILHIEDNPESLRLMHRLFASMPHLTLFDAHTGELGISLAVANPPALILLDMTLPGIDGWEVLRRLRSHPVTRDIPVVAMTVSSRALGVELGLSEFDDYIVKPADADRLQAMLNRRLVDGHKQPSESTTTAVKH